MRAQPGALEHGGEKGRARGVRSSVVRSVVLQYANSKRDGPRSPPALPCPVSLAHTAFVS